MSQLSKHSYDLVSHLHRQRKHSLKAFGPGDRIDGIGDHIAKELAEIKDDPSDLEERIDLVLLALDLAWRGGFEPEAIAAALEAKLVKNEQRRWPDWRTAPKDKAIEHDRGEEFDEITALALDYLNSKDAISARVKDAFAGMPHATDYCQDSIDEPFDHAGYKEALQKHDEDKS